MYFSYVVRPGELPAGRSPQFKPLWDSLINVNMRLGVFLQLVSFGITMVFGLLTFRGLGYKTIAYGGQKCSIVGLIVLVFAKFLGLMGSVELNAFRNIGDDECSIKNTRGYRAGVKFLNYATILDIVHYVAAVVYCFSVMMYLEDKWQIENTGGNPMSSFALIGCFAKFAALFFYGCAFFYMEAFHVSGTAETWGWSIALSYKLAAAALLVAILRKSRFFDLLFTAFYGLSLLSTFVWAQSFEPLVARYEVKLDQSALRNEWYKSKNAMSYFGPPLENESEFLKN